MTCQHCGASLHGRLNPLRRYCSRMCRSQAAYRARTAPRRERAQKRAAYRQQCADTSWESYGAA